jgi:hypothetical protein
MATGHERGAKGYTVSQVVKDGYPPGVPRSPTVALIAHLARVQELSADLARELAREHGNTATACAMADAIKRDVDTVHRVLSRPKR